MEKPKLRVSIVVLAYNEQEYLPACLEAIARQTVQPLEVIVVDNNSSDRTAEIARSFKNVQVIKEKKQGRIFAQVTGFNAAKGEIIGRIDADTRLADDWVSQAVNLFAEMPHVAAMSGTCTFYNFSHDWLASAATFLYYRGQQLIAGMTVLWGANMAIRKSAWELMVDDHTKQSNLHEDIDLSLRMHKRGLEVYFTRNLRASASLWRNDFSSRNIFRYTSTWPMTYAENGMPVRAVLIYGMRFLAACTLLPLFLLLVRTGHLGR